MSEERTIKGTIATWSRAILEPMPGFFKAGFKLTSSEEWHNITAMNEDELLQIKTDNPINSEVEFIEWQKEGSSYWNYKAGTWKLIKKGDGIYAGKKKSFSNFSYRKTREEMIMESASIQLLSILKTTASMNLPQTDIEATQEAMLQWHNDKLAAQAKVLDAIWKTNQPVEPAQPVVTEEKVN